MDQFQIDVSQETSSTALSKTTLFPSKASERLTALFDNWEAKQNQEVQSGKRSKAGAYNNTRRVRAFLGAIDRNKIDEFLSDPLPYFFDYCLLQSQSSNKKTVISALASLRVFFKSAYEDDPTISHPEHLYNPLFPSRQGFIPLIALEWRRNMVQRQHLGQIAQSYMESSWSRVLSYVRWQFPELLVKQRNGDSENSIKGSQLARNRKLFQEISLNDLQLFLELEHFRCTLGHTQQVAAALRDFFGFLRSHQLAGIYPERILFTEVPERKIALLRHYFRELSESHPDRSKEASYSIHSNIRSFVRYVAEKTDTAINLEHERREFIRLIGAKQPLEKRTSITSILVLDAERYAETYINTLVFSRRKGVRSALRHFIGYLKQYKHPES